jgi:hypothetical protein
MFAVDETVHPGWPRISTALIRRHVEWRCQSSTTHWTYMNPPLNLLVSSAWGCILVIKVGQTLEAIKSHALFDWKSNACQILPDTESLHHEHASDGRFSNLTFVGRRKRTAIYSLYRFPMQVQGLPLLVARFQIRLPVSGTHPGPLTNSRHIHDIY